jgi:HSP20 family protein
MLVRYNTTPETSWNKWIDSWFDGWNDSPLNKSLSSYAPNIDVEETDNALILTADIPGMKKDDISIELDSNILSIKGERKRESEKNGKNYRRSERYYGSFERSFSLASDINSDAIEADYKDGVLTLTLPKKEQAKAKKISLQ